MASYAHSILKPSGPGWRITFFDGKGDPVASFWAPTKDAALHQAKKCFA